MGATGQAAVTPQRIMQFAWGYAPPLAMAAAVEHGLFDLLDGGPKTAAEAASLAAISVRGARHIMDVLTGLGLLTKDADRRYALAPDSAAFLVSTKPGYIGGPLRHIVSELVPRWLQLPDIVRTGKPARAVNQEKAGTEFFHGFVESIFPMSYPAAQRLAAVLELAGATRPVHVLDLAAGSGVWGIAMAQASPLAQVTAVDWPGMLDVTRKMTDRFGVTARFTFVGGDLKDADFGADHDLAILGHILHSEGELRSRELLKKTARALAPGGTIAIQEFLVDEQRASDVGGLIFGVNMLVNTDEGDTFSFHEIAGWLTEAGFRNARLVDAPGPSPLILATRG